MNVDELVAYTVAKPRKSAKRYFAHANHLYTVAAVTNASGQVVERYSYDAYGKRGIVGSSSGVSAVGNGRGFTGYDGDGETGLCYARARMYSVGLGRFISRWNEINDDVNPYEFQWNDPANMVDPFGDPDRHPGHHIVPWSIFNGKVSEEVAFFFNSDLATIFHNDYKEHNFKTLNGVKHGEYNRLVKEELEKFLGNKAMEDMTMKEAIKFVQKIKNMPPGSDIAKFNQGVKMEMAASIKAALSSAGKMASASVGEKMASSAQKVSKTAKFCKAIPVVATFASAVFLVIDIDQRGLAGGIANSGMDAIPLFGQAKMASEWYTGINIIETN